MFGAFIVACGATHAMGIWTLWDPVYWYEGAVKAFAAVASIGTAYTLVRILPAALTLPSGTQLRTLNADLEREISARSVAEQELRQAKSELERRLKTTEALLASNRDLQQLAAITAHDLRAPVLSMTALMSMLQIRHGDQLGESGRNLVIRADRAANQMSELIEGMLLLARLDSPGQGMQEFDAQEAARDAVNQIESDIAMADAHVEIAKLPNIHANRAQFVQLLQNLIGNAVKYRDQSRQVQIRVSADDEEEHWLFRVEDNGIGIEREYHGRVFEIFQRLHGHEQYPGSGIGLAICQRIALRHGGKVWVNSEPGQGSTFVFLISKAPLIT
jgi:light-regulated signal transduction histidine kinase (bacteriophytochrome)